MLFKSSVGEGLFECYPIDEEGVGEGSTRDLLDTYELFVEVVLVEGKNGVDDHWAILVWAYNLSVVHILFVKNPVFLLINLLLIAVPANLLNVSRLLPSLVLTAISLILLTAIDEARLRPLMIVCELIPCST